MAIPSFCWQAYQQLVAKEQISDPFPFLQISTELQELLGIPSLQGYKL